MYDTIWILLALSAMGLLLWACRRADKKPKHGLLLGKHDSLYDSPEKPTMEEWINGKWDFSQRPGEQKDER